MCQSLTFVVIVYKHLNYNITYVLRLNCILLFQVNNAPTSHTSDGQSGERA